MLTHDDIELLMAALDSHALRREFGLPITAVVEAVLSSDSAAESAQKLQAKLESLDLVRATDGRRLADQVTLLKAKLIGLRQELDGEAAQRVMDEAGG